MHLAVRFFFFLYYTLVDRNSKATWWGKVSNIFFSFLFFWQMKLQSFCVIERGSRVDRTTLLRSHTHGCFPRPSFGMPATCHVASLGTLPCSTIIFCFIKKRRRKGRSGSLDSINTWMPGKCKTHEPGCWWRGAEWGERKLHLKLQRVLFLQDVQRDRNSSWAFECSNKIDKAKLSQQNSCQICVLLNGTGKKKGETEITGNMGERRQIVWGGWSEESWSSTWSVILFHKGV